MSHTDTNPTRFPTEEDFEFVDYATRRRPCIRRRHRKIDYSNEEEFPFIQDWTTDDFDDSKNEPRSHLQKTIEKFNSYAGKMTQDSDLLRRAFREFQGSSESIKLAKVRGEKRKDLVRGVKASLDACSDAKKRCEAYLTMLLQYSEEREKI